MTQATPVKVFDPLLRLTHWWIVLSIVSLIATSQLAELFEDGGGDTVFWQWHIVSGYALAAGLTVRVLWGLIGPVSARWKDLWHPSAWAGLASLRWPRARRGHDAMASLAFIGFYLIVALMVATGLGLAATEFQTGPLNALFGGMRQLEDLFKEPHEAGFTLILLFIGLHLGALAFHHWRGERVAQAMVTGRQYLDQDGEISHG
ncbi:cytochrome b/b6 domain-containing protein [Nitrogeniibacter mangrovi]|uniref:Cytochrome b/b6 domain-containing protein n=2 Tax=Nitrogeniibacter mangrovi TaxID=2016596 RepID=A0A6C1B7V5_9RHOO|nr:cytochrome b/b6 domain-containing protein [Nitrogeniibacter mangrovi]